jgi:hypothetical protein
MSWWSKTNNWDESCTVVLRHDLNIIDNGMNWNGSVSMGYEPNVFQMSMMECNYNDPEHPNVEISVNGIYGGSVDHWWMKVDDAELLIDQESQGRLITSMEYANSKSDLSTTLMAMSLKALDSSDEIVLHAENHLLWPSDEFVMTSLMNWVDVMDWNFSTSFYAKDHGFGMEFIQKSYGRDEGRYNMLASAHAVYAGADYTHWTLEVKDTHLGYDNTIIAIAEAWMEFTDPAAHPANGALRGYIGLFDGNDEAQFVTDQAWVWSEGQGMYVFITRRFLFVITRSLIHSLSS